MRILAIPTLVRVVLGFLIFASLTACSWAQTDAGSIVGSVKDPSGAVVANASVTVSDVEHGQTVSITTNVDGEFVVSPLRVGR